MGQIEAELPPEPELAEGEGEVKQPPQEHQETDKRTSFADRQAMLWSGSVVGRSSLVSASMFHFKARAHMQSLKLRASKRNPAQSSQEFGWQSLVRDLVFSSLFSAIITVLILVNVILLGVEVDLYASLDVNQEVPSWYGTANAIIVGIFVLEIGLKIFALGCRDFWCGRDSAWNVLDFTIVFISVLDVVLQLLSSTLDTGIASLVRAIRIARAVRGIRLIRIFRYITALRTLALSIISTLGSLFWTMALFMLMFYFFAIVLTQLVADNCRFLKMDGDSLGTGPLCREILPKYWASVPESSWDLRPMVLFFCCIFPRGSERRVLLIVGVCYTSSHLSFHIYTDHLHIFTSSHPHIFTSSHPHICTSSHIFSLFLSFSLSLFFTSSHLHIFTSSHLHIFTSSHLHIFTSSHLHIFTSSLSPSLCLSVCLSVCLAG